MDDYSTIFEQYAAIRSYQVTLALSPDSKKVAYSTNITGQFNLWTQAFTGCARQRTVFTDWTVRAVVWSPDGETIAFQADKVGNENTQLFTIDARTGWPQRITHVDDARYFLAGWSPQGKYWTYTSNERQRNVMDIMVEDTLTGESFPIMSGGLYFAAAWSPDETGLLVIEPRSNSHTNTWYVQPGTEPQLLTPAEQPAIHNALAWFPDNRSFLMLTDEGRNFKGLARYDLETRTWQWLETPDWDVEAAVLSKDGTLLLWVVNEGGFSKLYLRDLDSGDMVVLPAIPKGVIFHPAITNDSRSVVFFLARPTQASEIMRIDLEHGSLEQITQSSLGGLDPTYLIEPDLISYASFDKKPIPAFVFRPDLPVAKCPVVVSLHGGPELQERPIYMYSGLYQYLLSKGIGVVAPNIRGSTGYGHDFQRLILRDWGGAELKDIEALVGYLHTLEWVDPTKIGIFGGSFGGFATLSAISRLPNLWSCAVEWFGPSNLVTFTKNIPSWWESTIEAWVGHPERDYDLLVERSPLTYADAIKVPLFVIQGAQDPRVVESESTQIVENLRSRNHAVRYDVYADEGHGFTKKHNELQAIRDTADWLIDHLLT